MFKSDVIFCGMIVSLMTIWSGSGATAEKNLLPNGTFEERDLGWGQETGDVNSISYPDGVAKSGDGCAQFNFTGKNWLWLIPDVSICAQIPWESGSGVRVTFWAKWLSGDNRISAGFNVRGKSDSAWIDCKDNLAIATVPKDGLWHYIEMSLVAPAFDSAVGCLQLKFGAHESAGIEAESFLIDDLSMFILQVRHQLRLKFEDGTPEDGWGTNLSNIALFVNNASKPGITFWCNTPDEKIFLAEDRGSFTYERCRVADGSNYFVYELPIVEERLQILTLELGMCGTFLVRLSIDNGPFVLATRSPEPVHSSKNTGVRRINLLPLKGVKGFILNDSEICQGKLFFYLFSEKPLPGDCQMEWFLAGQKINTVLVDKISETTNFVLDYSTLPPDDRWFLPIGFRLCTAKDKELARTEVSLNIPNYNLMEKKFLELANKEKVLQSLLAEAEQQQVSKHDADIVLKALRYYPAYIRNDFQSIMIDRSIAAIDFLSAEAQATIEAINTSLKKGEKETMPIMPSMLRLYARDGGFYQGDSPVFLIGPMRDRITIEELKDIAQFGFNSIELVVAPSWDSPDDYKYYTDFLNMCEEKNIAAYVLLSAHYVPKEWLKKYPEIGSCGKVFMPWCICNPRTRELIEQWYRKIIPFLKDKPAVLSYCLANEPHYINTGYCNVCKACFHQWLKEKYSTIDNLNRRWGTELTDFAQAEPVKKKESSNAAAYSDWFRFNEYRMKEFFQWERKIIKGMDPHTPIHNESMAWLAFSSENDGIDFEDQAGLSDIHGCDGGTKWIKGGKYAMDWINGQSMPYDMMKSIAPAMPIFNSEWHIVDENTLEIPPQYMRTTAWLAALHGQAGATIWVWLRQWESEGQKFCFLTRPGIVIAAGKVTRELNRFAHEVRLFQLPPRKGHSEVCLLYSTSSLVHDPNYGRICEKVYEPLYFLDTPLGFVTERQAERGEFGGCKFLVVPAANYVTDTCVDGIQQFVKEGGTLVVVGDCMKYNEYGDIRTASSFLSQKSIYGKGKVIHTTTQAQPQLFDRLIAECGVVRPVRSRTEGVVCRTVLDEHNSRFLTMLINLTDKEKEVALDIQVPHGKICDLLTKKVVLDKVVLGGLQVALIEVPLTK